MFEVNELNRYSVRPGPRGFPSREAWRAIKLVVFDVDGMLTDARIIIDSNGIESKFFNVRDGAGVTFLVKAAMPVALLTGRSSAVVDFRAKELSIPPTHVKQGAKVKLPVFNQLLAENQVKPEETLYAGDDLIDLPVLKAAGIACCPADAHPEVQALCHLIAYSPSGHGAARAICEQILKQREDGSWERALGRYLGTFQ